ncbi:MAG: hypothetical protein ACWA44_01000, partial [Thiotrichales bacterium]
MGLAEFSAEITQHALERLKTEANDDPGANNKVAGLFNNLSIRLSALGQREAALSAAQEAADLYRELTRDR